MSNQRLELKSVITPCFVVDECTLRSELRRLSAAICRSDHVRQFFSMKSCATSTVLSGCAEFVSGFSVSSLNEARLARFIAPLTEIAFAAPIIRAEDVNGLVELCDRVSVNSFRQLELVQEPLSSVASVGIRVNPGISVVDDVRYDPCMPGSRLGIELRSVACEAAKRTSAVATVRGLHFHSNCDCDSVEPWIRTIRHVEEHLGFMFPQLDWLNIGGGYTFKEPGFIETLNTEIERLHDQYGLEIVIEPGAAFVRKAGSFVSTVHDIVKGDGFPIAILDLSVNHWPEVFEYQFEPDVSGHREGAPNTYQLAGCSCLAGDIFGVYSFDEPLEVGSRVVFENAGAYSIVKAHMFNGIDLPSIYAKTVDGDLVLQKRFGYDDYLMHCGVNPVAAI